jgi:hypothetical protein
MAGDWGRTFVVSATGARLIDCRKETSTMKKINTKPTKQERDNRLKEFERYCKKNDLHFVNGKIVTGYTLWLARTFPNRT